MDNLIATRLQQAGGEERYTFAVQNILDSAAKSKGYDSILSACTYADDATVPRFQAEGQAFRTWRSQCWDYCYQQLGAYQAGTIAQPTVAEILVGLPAPPTF